MCVITKLCCFPMGASKKMLVISHRQFFSITGEDSFLSACFFPTSSLKPFLGYVFSFVTVFHKLFGNMTRCCLAQMSGPHQQQFQLPPSFCPHSFPKNFCYLFQISTENLSDLFSVCGKGIAFHLYYYSLSQNFLGYYLHKLRSKSHIL